MKSERAKACAITASTKKKVFARDDGRCIICGRPGNPEAHYIRRSKGGLGIEQNIVTLCRPCHERFDQGNAEEVKEYRKLIKKYLESKYEGWNEEDLYYSKWR